MMEENVVGIAGQVSPFIKDRHNHRIPNNTSVKEIFGKHYLCRFSDILTRHPDDLRTFGIRMSGHPDIDKELQKAEVTSWTTIATMAHYLRLGIPVKVVNHADCRAIYESVTKHIKAWRDNYSFSLNQNVVPVEDLQALEDLSIKVFPAAKGLIQKDGYVRDYFDKAIGKFNLVSEENLFVRDDFNKKHEIQSTVNKEPARKIEVIREDFSDYLLEKVSQLGGGNKIGF